MRLRSGLLATALLAGAAGAAGIASAPPASAGCLSIDAENTFCDEPVAPDGSWRRCHQNAGQVIWQNGWVFRRTSPTNFCYRVDPSQPWPASPAGQPQYHVD